MFIYLKGFPDSSVGKESTCNAGYPSLIPGLGRFPGEGIGYPLQYSSLENSMDCVVHGVTKLGMTVQLSLSFSKEINLEYSLERLMLKLKLQHFVKNRLIGKDPGAGKD